MNEREYAHYSNLVAPTPPFIHAADVLSGGTRTLVYGYTLERNSFHVWLEMRGDDSNPSGWMISRCVYNSVEVLSHGYRRKWDAEILYPSKRAYVESTDYLFARVMHSRGFPLCFAKPRWADDIKRRNRYGRFSGRTFP